MEELVLFGLTYVFILLIYEIFIVSKTKKRKAKGKAVKEPMEVKYLMNVYKLDMDKVNYNQLLQIISLVSSLDISLVVSLVYLFYKKKGMIK